MAKATVKINRAPVLTLWGAVVAERMGYAWEEALTLGKAVAGLNAQAKGRRLKIFGEPKKPERGGPPKKVGLGEEFWVEVVGRPVPAKSTDEGVRAVVLDKPIDPAKVEKYLKSKFGEDLDAARGPWRSWRSLLRRRNWPRLLTACTRRSDRRSPPGRKGGGRRAISTWASFDR